MIFALFKFIKISFLFIIINGDKMKIRLGYACVPVTINETSSHSLTYTHYKRLGDKANEKLDGVIKNNFESLEKILKYNIKNDITII